MSLNLQRQRAQTRSRPTPPGENFMLIAFSYLVLLTMAEIATTLLVPRATTAVVSFVLMQYILLLVLLMVHSAVRWGKADYRLLLALSSTPLIRIISLSLPLGYFPRIYWYLITSLPLFVAAFLIMRQQGYTWHAWGINGRYLLWQIPIGLSGFAIGYVEYLILQPEPLVDRFSWETILLPALILIICTGLLEEIIFRRMMQLPAVDLLGRWRGIVYVAAVFAVLHVGYNSVSDVIFVFLAGLFFGWAANKTDSIVGVTISHGLANTTLFLVMPFGVVEGLPTAVSPAFVQFLQAYGLWLALLAASFGVMGLLMALPSSPPAEQRWE